MQQIVEVPDRKTKIALKYKGFRWLPVETGLYNRDRSETRRKRSLLVQAPLTKQNLTKSLMKVRNESKTRVMLLEADRVKIQNRTKIQIEIQNRGPKRGDHKRDQLRDGIIAADARYLKLEAKSSVA